MLHCVVVNSAKYGSANSTSDLVGNVLKIALGDNKVLSQRATSVIKNLLSHQSYPLGLKYSILLHAVYVLGGKEELLVGKDSLAHLLRDICIYVFDNEPKLRENIKYVIINKLPQNSNLYKELYGLMHDDSSIAHN